MNAQMLKVKGVAALRVRDDLAGLDVGTLTDAQLPLLRAMLLDDISENRDPRTILVAQAEAEIKKRLLERGAKALPVTTHIVELEDQYTPYVFDLDKLRAARAMLPDDEAAKILKFVPELIPAPIPEHYDPGPAVSINAIINKYGVDDDGNPTSEVGKLLKEAMTRQKTDVKLIIKPRPIAQRNVTPTAEPIVITTDEF